MIKKFSFDRINVYILYYRGGPVEFKGKILVIGCGSVSQCAIPLVLKLIDAPPKNITIMDFADNRRDEVIEYAKRKAKTIRRQT